MAQFFKAGDYFAPDALPIAVNAYDDVKPSCLHLHDFCERLEKGCCGSHKWTRVTEEPDRIGYHFTRCMWAEIYNELGEPELGFYLCAGDEPGVKSYNPKLGFRRTKVLMNGDEVCDHIFLVEK